MYSWALCMLYFMRACWKEVDPIDRAWSHTLKYRLELRFVLVQLVIYTTALRYKSTMTCSRILEKSNGTTKDGLKYWNFIIPVSPNIFQAHYNTDCIFFCLVTKIQDQSGWNTDKKNLKVVYKCRFVVVTQHEYKLNH